MVAKGQAIQPRVEKAMIPGGAAKKAPTGFSNRSTRSRLTRLVRMAVAFLVVAGSLGLATVTATAQSTSSSCPSAGADAYADLTDQTNFAYDDSRCLKELDIPAPGNNYRPDDLMTRSEMARFMARTYAIVTGNDAPVVATDFTDISADPNADDIARIFGLEITIGTTPTTYSPDIPVIRGYMALFLTRLYKQATGSDAPTADTPFTDISNRTREQETAIGQIYRLGVTTGTSDTTYSPGDNVTRRQMASFVARIYRVLDAITPIAVADAPTDLEVAVSGNDGTALDVNWTAPTDTGSVDIIDYYLLQWKTGDTNFTPTNQLDTTATSASFDDFTEGDTYTFRVAARTAAGLGEWSDEASGSPAVAPGLVGNLRSTPRNALLALS